MPLATHDGARIYYEIEGSGPPLLLHHSFMRSRLAWRDFGYTAPLSAGHQLILMDARGHGDSDKPADPAAYQMDILAGDVLAVLDAAGVAETLYWGYSLGAILGYHLARLAPARFRAMLLGGAGPQPPHPEDGRPFTAPLRAMLHFGAEKGMAAVVALQERAAGPLPPASKAILLASDPSALLAALASIETRPDVSDALPAMTFPCLLYAGDADPAHAGVQACAAQLADAAFVALPGAIHSEGFSRSELILPAALEFLRRRRPTGATGGVSA